MKMNLETLEAIVAYEVTAAFVPVTAYATAGEGFPTIIKYASQGNVPAMLAFFITQSPAIVYGFIGLIRYISKHLKN